jgi:hypothetical protein
LVTPIAFGLQSKYLGDSVNKNQIVILPLATNNMLLLHFANEMVLSLRNVGIQHKIIGVLDFVIPKIV